MEEYFFVLAAVTVIGHPFRNRRLEWNKEGKKSQSNIQATARADTTGEKWKVLNLSCRYCSCWHNCFKLFRTWTNEDLLLKEHFQRLLFPQKANHGDGSTNHTTDKDIHWELGEQQKQTGWCVFNLYFGLGLCPVNKQLGAQPSHKETQNTEIQRKQQKTRHSRYEAC